MMHRWSITGDVVNLNKIYSLKTQFRIQAEGPLLSGGEWLLIAAHLFAAGICH